MARVVALIPDLLFGSRVQAMLTGAGHEVQLCAEEDVARAQAPDADLLVVDLTTDAIDGATLVESMLMGGEIGAHQPEHQAQQPAQQSHEPQHQTRTLGFYSHVEADTRQRAIEAGFDLVVPRSRMAREGAELVASLLGG